MKVVIDLFHVHSTINGVLCWLLCITFLNCVVNSISMCSCPNGLTELLADPT